MNYYIELSDKRNICLYELMKQKGYAVYPFSQNGQNKKDYSELEKDVFVFSPAKRVSLQEISALPNNSVLYAGNLGEEQIESISDKNIRHINYMENNSFAAKNAGLTAEGVLCLSIEKTKKSIYDISILVLGNGKCGSAISELFGKLGLDFTVARRRVESATDTINGQKTIDEPWYKSIDFEGLARHLPAFDLIINTVPAKIIDENAMMYIDKKAVVIEVASVPCLDKEIADFEYIAAPGLPQVYSCESAAKIIFELILQNS